MSTTTANFGIVLPEGSDTFNPLTFDNNAFTRVDEVMKVNQDRGITPATHSFLEGIHTIVRTVTSCPTLVFVASADWTATDSIAVDGVTMTLRYADGSLPSSNAFRTNQAVMCYVNGTILTVISCTGEEAVKAKIQALTDIIGDAADLPDPEASVVANVAECYNNLSGLFTNYDKLGESHNNTVSLSIDKTKYKELFLAVEDTTQNNVLYSITIPKALWNVKSFYLYQTNFNVKVTSGITQLISTSLPDDRWNAILYGIY